MGVYENIDIDFARRTLKIVERYDRTTRRGPENYEVTLLINCLLGLLVLPQQKRVNLVPDVSINDLNDWSFQSSFIQSWGRLKKGQNATLRELIHRLRNSIAHFHIEAEGTQTDIERLKFFDRNGFRANIPVANLRAFVRKLASTISGSECS